MCESGQSEVCIVVGTRPEIIKMAPVIRAVESSDYLFPYIIHTNQHYDDNLSGAFFQDLNLREPDSNLRIGSGSQAKQTADGLVGIERVIEKRLPKIVLAQGDTNAVLSAAIATAKMDSAFGHVEAGIRSFDRTMPEEINRIVADNLADLLFAPTETAARNLADEEVRDGVYVTGNTVVDACHEHVRLASKQSSILERLDVDSCEYVVATIHRPRNTDNPERLKEIVNQLNQLSIPVVFPAHPRTRNRMDELDLTVGNTIRLIEPLDYLDFLKLESSSTVIVTDSGGVQEEASILQVPCLTVRPNTERPETVKAGVNRLIQPSEVNEAVKRHLIDESHSAAMRGHPDLYGDGKAGQRIAAALTEYVAEV